MSENGILRIERGTPHARSGSKSGYRMEPEPLIERLERFACMGACVKRVKLKSTGGMPLNAFGLAKKPPLQIGPCFWKWPNAGGISPSGLSGGDT